MFPLRNATLIAMTVAGALHLVACGGHETTGWADLAAVPSSSARRQSSPDLPQQPIGGRGVRLVDEADGTRWLELLLERSDWTRDARPNTWVASIPKVRDLGHAADPAASTRLRAPGRTFRHAGLRNEEGDLDVGPGSFLVSEEAVHLELRAQEEPLPLTALGWLATHGERSQMDQALVRGRVFSGSGLAVAPGERRELQLDLPAGAALGFATCSEPALLRGDERHVFRVRLDERVLFEHVQGTGERGSSRWHRVPLPDGAHPGATLSFEVDGPFAYTSFLAPSVGPRELPSPGERSAGRGRPNLVLFLADTLRADRLGAFGGTEQLTPNLDRLAQESLVFTRARSVSTWTLPAHASLFTGLFPHQTGAVTMTAALPRETETLAELLRDHGYRTGAVTEGGFLSANHGFEQGFQWFAEREIDWDGERDDDLAATLDAALRFVDADDGRPFFLFVHTFRTHAPYDVSRETREAHGERLGLGFPEDYQELRSRWREREGPVSPDEELSRKMSSLYDGAVLDLDRAFGRFVGDLRARGALNNGYLLFTSDHGETFGEHGELYHTGPVHEELVRIPLLLTGAGVEHAEEQAPVSLIDVFPTFAQLAGVQSAEGLGGRSLFEQGGERVLYAFECGPEEAPGTLAIVDGDRKVIGFFRDLFGSREVYAAFELDRDPGERVDLSHQGADWPVQLLERQSDELDAYLSPVFTPTGAALDAEDRAELQALGYLDD